MNSNPMMPTWTHIQMLQMADPLVTLPVASAVLVPPIVELRWVCDAKSASHVARVVVCREAETIM